MMPNMERTPTEKRIHAKSVTRNRYNPHQIQKVLPPRQLRNYKSNVTNGIRNVMSSER